MNNLIKPIFDKYSKEYAIQSKKTIKLKRFITDIYIDPFIKELMTTVYKDTPTEEVVNILRELDHEKLFISQYTEESLIDVNYEKKEQRRKQLAELPNLPIEELEKRFEAYKAIGDIAKVEEYERYVNLCKTKDIDIPEKLVKLISIEKYFLFNDFVSLGNNTLLKAYIDSFRTFSGEDALKTFSHTPDPKKFLEATKKLFPNVKADNVHICANAFKQFIQKIYYNCGKKVSNPQKMLFLYSMLGGTGKGVFMNRLIHFCETYKIPVGKEANVSSHWLSSEFSTNMVSVIPEFFPYKSNMNEQIISLNNIIDNGSYRVELKGYQPISMKSNTALVCGSNKKPYDVNDRRYNIVEYNTVQLFDEEAIEKYSNYLNTSFTDEEWDQVFLDAFRYCPFDCKFKSKTPVKYVSETYYDFIDDLRLLKEVQPDFFIEPHTVREIAKWLQIQADGKAIKALAKEYKKYVFKNLLGLVNEKIIKPAKVVNGDLLYSKYDINEIANLVVSSDAIDDCSPVKDPIIETAKAWDSLIADYNNGPDKPNPTPDKPNPRKIVEAKAEAKAEAWNSLISNVAETTKAEAKAEAKAEEPLDTIAEVEKAANLLKADSNNEEVHCADDLDNVYTPEMLNKFKCPVKKDTFSKPSFNIEGNEQFLVTARYKDSYIKSNPTELDAKGEHMLPVFFVYEMDDTDIETQYSIAEKLYKKNVWTITFSGSKSLHTLVYIDPTQAEVIAKDFKYYWNIAAEKLYGKAATLLDSACASVARLSRFPNGFRPDKNETQWCNFKNDNVVPIDLSKEIAIHEEELRQKSLTNLIVSTVASENKNSYDDPDSELHLRKAVAKSGNPAGQIAVDLLDGIDPGSGANYIGAIGYCQRAIGPKTARRVKEAAHRLHPTNV